LHLYAVVDVENFIPGERGKSGTFLPQPDCPSLAVLFQGIGILSYRPENKIMMYVSNNAESAGSQQGASRFDDLTSRLSERGNG